MMTDFDPASIIWCSQKLFDFWVNGDGYYMYPGPDGPISTSRLEEIRDALVLHLTMLSEFGISSLLVPVPVFAPVLRPDDYVVCPGPSLKMLLDSMG